MLELLNNKEQSTPTSYVLKNIANGSPLVDADRTGFNGVIVHPAKRHLHFALDVINPPFSHKRSLRVEEKLFILSQIVGDWILEVSDFFGIGMLSVAVVTDRFKYSDVPSAISHRQLTRLLSMDGAKLEAYAKKKEWSLADKRRLMRWSRWSKSAEKAALEKFFRGMWDKREGNGYQIFLRPSQ
jgi:hypothetical protein